MKHIRHVAVFAGTSDNGSTAIREAADLANRNRALVTVVDVLKPVPRARRFFTTDDDARQLEAECCVERRDELRAAHAETFDGLDWTVDVRVGRPATEIVRLVLGEGCDLVLKTADGGGALRRRVFGSVGNELLRVCPCPVWLVRPSDSERRSNIAVSVDVSVDDSSTRGLNSRLVELAFALAEIEGARLHVVHAWHVWMERALRGRGRFRPDEIANLSEVQRTTARTEIERLLELHGAPIDETRIHIVKGDPEDVVPEIVEEHDIDLLVMGTLCRTGIAGLFVGNTAERILDAVDVDLLTVKPDDFRSPVTLE